MYSKSCAVLYIFESLKEKKRFTRADLSKELGVSPVTISRYISEINNYFSDFFIPHKIIYDKDKNTYILEDTIIKQ